MEGESNDNLIKPEETARITKKAKDGRRHICASRDFAPGQFVILDQSLITTSQIAYCERDAAPQSEVAQFFHSVVVLGGAKLATMVGRLTLEWIMAERDRGSSFSFSLPTEEKSVPWPEFFPDVPGAAEKEPPQLLRDFRAFGKKEVLSDLFGIAKYINPNEPSETMPRVRQTWCMISANAWPTFCPTESSEMMLGLFRFLPFLDIDLEAPNVMVQMMGAHASVIAIRPIKKDERLRAWRSFSQTGSAYVEEKNRPQKHDGKGFSPLSQLKACVQGRKKLSTEVLTDCLQWIDKIDKAMRIRSAKMDSRNWLNMLYAFSRDFAKFLNGVANDDSRPMKWPEMIALKHCQIVYGAVSSMILILNATLTGVAAQFTSDAATSSDALVNTETGKEYGRMCVRLDESVNTMCSYVMMQRETMFIYLLGTVPQISLEGPAATQMFVVGANYRELKERMEKDRAAAEEPVEGEN